MAQENSTQQDHKKMISELEKAQSFSRMVYDQFKRNKAALFGAYTILFFVLIAVGAPIISYVTGLDPSTVNAINRYKPPMSRITVSSDVKESKLKAFIENHPADKIEILKNQLIEKQIVSPPTPEDALYEWITLAPS
jgi:hypothetical protein